uniref:Uncharacterized protein n=1 Tax=Arundo donax TaxID=35708 RepID=A0A0A9AAG0_ARUDO
MMALSAGMQPQ